MVKLSPLTWSDDFGRMVPIYDVYGAIMDWLDRRMQRGGKDYELASKHRERIFGTVVIEHAPDEYWDIALSRELKISLQDWKDLDLHLRAQYRAQFQLSNMAETIRAHRDELKEQRRQLRKSNAS